MNSRFALLIAVAACATGTAAFAQTAAEISIVAPHESHAGPTPEIVSIQHLVSFSDLDLTKTADVVILKTRVTDAAKSACKQIDRLYPETRHKSKECYHTTLDNAQAQVDAAIAAALKH